MQISFAKGTRNILCAFLLFGALTACSPEKSESSKTDKAAQNTASVDQGDDLECAGLIWAANSLASDGKLTADQWENDPMNKAMLKRGERWAKAEGVSANDTISHMKIKALNITKTMSPEDIAKGAKVCVSKTR